MSDLPLDETALQAAHNIGGGNLTWKEMEAAISTYLREAQFKLEKDGPHTLYRPHQRQVGPWEPIPVVQAESEEG